MDVNQFAAICGRVEDSHHPEADQAPSGGWDRLIPVILDMVKACQQLRGKSDQQKHKWIERHPRQARKAIVSAATQRGVSRLEAERLADRMLEEFEGLSDMEFAGIVTSLSTGGGT